MTSQPWGLRKWYPDGWTGAFWGTFAATLIPYYNAYGAYVTNPNTQAASMGNPGNSAGVAVPAFNASFAYFLVFMGELSFPLPIQLSM